MTNGKPAGDWSDDRLDAAFAARAAAAPPAPSRLADDAVARLPRHGGARNRPWTWMAAGAAALLVAAVIGFGGLLNQRPPQPGPSTPIAASSASTEATDIAQTPAPTSAALAALGEPLTVSAALALRDSGERDREILVRGFLSHAPAMFCPLVAGPGNPTIITCPENWQWLMEAAETFESKEPAGPALHASFALVEPPLPLGSPSEPPVPVGLIGHFNDRRAQLCDAMNVCEETFVVDRVLDVDGEPVPVRTGKHVEPRLKDIDEDLDALVAGAAPGSVVLSRQVVEAKQAFAIEPVLADDPVLSAWDPKGPLWLVTALDIRPAGPIARTFALIDGSNWFAEVTANGARYLDRTVPTASGGPDAPPASGDPSAFVAAPPSVLGIPVRTIADLERARAADMAALGSNEHAIRAWYLGPPPGVTCSVPLEGMHPPAPPCDDARHWLLDDPSQYGREPGQLRQNPAADHYPPVLNPLLPADVPFDAGETWQGSRPVPRPVIVLGHFGDDRVRTYAGNLYFVIDALAWLPDRTVELTDRVVRLTQAATEEPASVLRRVQDLTPDQPVITWTTVVDASDFATFDPDGGDIAEFRSGPPVWIVHRLIHNERDGRQRLAIQAGWTADHGERVWWTECPDCGPDLGTTLDIVNLDVNTPIVHVYDYDRIVTAVGPATGLSGLDWHQPRGNSTDDMDVAIGRNPSELVVRWTTPTCVPAWNVEVREFDGGSVYVSAFVRGDFEPDDTCGDSSITRRIVLQLDHPIDIDKVQGPSCCG